MPSIVEQAIENYQAAINRMKANWDAGVGNIRALIKKHGAGLQGMNEGTPVYMLSDLGYSTGTGRTLVRWTVHPDGDECARIEQTFRDRNGDIEIARRQMAQAFEDTYGADIIKALK